MPEVFGITIDEKIKELTKAITTTAFEKADKSKTLDKYTQEERDRLMQQVLDSDKLNHKFETVLDTKLRAIYNAFVESINNINSAYKKGEHDKRRGRPSSIALLWIYIENGNEYLTYWTAGSAKRKIEELREQSNQSPRMEDIIAYWGDTILVGMPATPGFYESSRANPEKSVIGKVAEYIINFLINPTKKQEEKQLISLSDIYEEETADMSWDYEKIDGFDKAAANRAVYNSIKGKFMRKYAPHLKRQLVHSTMQKMFERKAS